MSEETEGPDDVAKPSKPVEADISNQTPPPGYEPQVDLSPDQTGGMSERSSETVEDVSAEESSVTKEDAKFLGSADDDDDDAEDGEPGDD